MNRVPPRLISMENAMEDFWEEHRKKGLKAAEESTLRKQWMDAHIAAFPEAYKPKPKPWKLKAAIACGLALWLGWLFIMEITK